MKYARCPYCGWLLTEDESYDLDIDTRMVQEYVAGHCDNCDKEFQWKNIYQFQFVGCIEEI